MSIIRAMKTWKEKRFQWEWSLRRLRWESQDRESDIHNESKSRLAMQSALEAYETALADWNKNR